MSFQANVKTHDNRYFHMREQYGLLWAGQWGADAYMLDPGQAIQIASLLRGWAEHAIAHATTQAIRGVTTQANPPPGQESPEGK